MTWTEFWDSVSVLQFVLWFLAALAVVAFFVKAWPKIRAAVKLIDALGQLPAFIDESRVFRTETNTAISGIVSTLAAQDTRIADIHHETHHNNGSSLKDAQVRTEQAVERIELGVKGLYDRADKSDESDAEIREELERTRPAARKPRVTKPKE